MAAVRTEFSIVLLSKLDRSYVSRQDQNEFFVSESQARKLGMRESF